MTIRDDAEDEDGVPDQGERDPELEHDETGTSKKLPVEGDVNRTDCLVAVADEEGRNAVDDEADDGKRPEGPG